MQNIVFSQKFYNIPEQYLDLTEMTGTDKTFKAKVNKFKISEFITLGEYKDFLSSIKKDSSETYYLNMLPDSVIALTPAIYTEYLNNKEYEKYPVLGVKWDSAIEFCKWKSRIHGKSSKFYYSLPTGTEWLAAYSFLKKNNKKHDFNKKYSDMTLSSYDESAYFINHSMTQTIDRFDYQYYHKQSDSPALKRKRIVGSSYLYDMNIFLNNSFYIYSYEGYRHVSFRIVKHRN